MSSSVDDVSRTLAEDERLLASPSSYSMDVFNSRYHDGTDYPPANHRPSISSDRNEEHPFQTKFSSSLDSVFRRQKGRKVPGTRILRALYQWAQGPRPPRLLEIKPLVPQIAHSDLLEKFFPGQRQKFWLLMIFFLLWLVVLIVVLSTSLFRCQVPGYEAPVRLSCVSRFW